MYLVIDKREVAFLYRSSMDKLKETFIYKEYTDSIFPTLFTKDICVLIRALHSESFFFFSSSENYHSDFLTKYLLILRKYDIKTMCEIQE